MLLHCDAGKKEKKLVTQMLRMILENTHFMRNLDKFQVREPKEGSCRELRNGILRGSDKWHSTHETRHERSETALLTIPPKDVSAFRLDNALTTS